TARGGRSVAGRGVGEGQVVGGGRGQVHVGGDGGVARVAAGEGPEGRRGGTARHARHVVHGQQGRAHGRGPARHEPGGHAGGVVHLPGAGGDLLELAGHARQPPEARRERGDAPEPGGDRTAAAGGDGEHDGGDELAEPAARVLHERVPVDDGLADEGEE